ncbi:MAG TPA: ATP-grasp domain-containing protein [Anaerolineae bacterium]|nr:ATP-grasp domain-containing protein [Anaerolineae bacterium]
MPVRSDPARILILSNEDSTWTPRDYAEVDLELARMHDGLIESGYQVEVFTVLHSVKEELGRQSRYHPADWLIVNWCEQYIDRPWTDAEIAQEIEDLGYVFTGADGRALRLSLDKTLVRRCLIEAGVTVPIGQVYHDDHLDDWKIFPAIVKPSNTHASDGITPASLVESPIELKRQVQAVLDQYQRPVIVEEYIDGREIHLPLLGNRSIEPIAPMEIDFTLFNDIHDRFYTNEAKFDRESARYQLVRFLCPAPIDARLYARMVEIAQTAYRAVGCRDYARIDLRLRGDQLYVLDVNHNADLTSEAEHSIASKMMGWSYGQLASRIIECALERWPDRANSR